MQFVKFKTAHQYKRFRESGGSSEKRETRVADKPLKKPSLISQLKDLVSVLLYLWKQSRGCFTQLPSTQNGQATEPHLDKGRSHSISRRNTSKLNALISQSLTIYIVGSLVPFWVWHAKTGVITPWGCHQDDQCMLYHVLFAMWCSLTIQWLGLYFHCSYKKVCPLELCATTKLLRRSSCFRLCERILLNAHQTSFFFFPGSLLNCIFKLLSQLGGALWQL